MINLIINDSVSFLEILDSSVRRYRHSGWQGLTGKANDLRGSVHGVCSGSRYSFTGDYYKQDLLMVVNGNHGIEIMMLAGVEIIKLKGMLGGQ